MLRFLVTIAILLAAGCSADSTPPDQPGGTAQVLGATVDPSPSVLEIPDEDVPLLHLTDRESVTILYDWARARGDWQQATVYKTCLAWIALQDVVEEPGE